MKTTQGTSLVPWLAWLPAVLVAASGCLAVGADAHLDYDGRGNGSHSETASCGDKGTIRTTGEVHDGRLTIRLTDSGDTEVFQKEFRNGSIEMTAVEARGDSGTWTLSASRSGDDLAGDSFNGNYQIRLDC